MVKQVDDQQGWPFAAWLDVAVRIFGLTPQSFWAMSLFDWLTLISQRAGHENKQPISRKNLSEMITDFPDKNNKSGTE